MDPVVDRPVSPYSVRGIARGVRSLYGSAVDGTSQAIEAVARPFSRPVGYQPAAAAPAPAVVAPAPVAPAAVAPAAVQPAPPTVGGAVDAIRARHELLGNLKDGGMVGRDGYDEKKPARGARRKAMPGRGSDPHRSGVQMLKDGGQVDRKPHGEVQGPGTGTSDSVPAQMPQGTYVMPADTTERVNLSDGEFKVAPEVVMAAGAAALDAVRQATHQPTEPTGDDGYNNGGKICPPGSKKAMGARRKGYADGGLVIDEDRRPGGAVFGMYPSAAGTRGTSYAADARLRTGRLADGSAPAPYATGVRGLPEGVQPSTAGAGRGSVNPPAADPGMTATAPASVALATTPAVASTAAAPKMATGMVMPETAPTQPAAPAQPAAAPAGPSQSQQNIEMMGRAGQTYREIAAMQNAGGNQPAMVMPDRQAERNAAFDRQTLIDQAARRGGRGARALLDVVTTGDRVAGDMANTATREAGATTRAATQEAGAAAREQARLASQESIEQGRRAAEAPEREVRIGVGRQQLAEGDRMARLRARLDAATDPAMRRQLQEQLLAEQGKAPAANRFTVVPGGSGVDPATGQVVREPSQVLDNQSGQFVQQGTQAAAAPKVTPRAEYDKLPKGARYTGPDGRTYIKG